MEFFPRTSKKRVTSRNPPCWPCKCSSALDRSIVTWLSLVTGTRPGKRIGYYFTFQGLFVQGRSIFSKMKSLLLCLSLLGVTLAFTYPRNKPNDEACYQPKFDKGIKEVMWVAAELKIRRSYHFWSGNWIISLSWEQPNCGYDLESWQV